MKVLFVGENFAPAMGGAHGFMTTVKAALDKVPSPRHTFHFGTAPTAGYDFTWFLSPSPQFAQCQTPFAFTVWDVAHRVHPYFPEVSLTGWKFDSREARYRDALPRASIISIGTDTGAAQLDKFWGIPRERVLVNPLPVNPIFAAMKGDPSILAKHNLTFSKYLLYPAQFWPHKNHITAIDTLKLLPDDMRLVFTGSDKGNEKYVRNYARERLPADRVVFAGFVEIAELVALYRNAHAMLFCSLMGPDNLPPLEALSVGCPVACAYYDGAQDQCYGPGVFFFSPLEPRSAVVAVRNAGREPRVSRIVATGDDYARNIMDSLDRFAYVRRLWGASYTHL